MPSLSDTIVIDLRGDRFILSCSTILAYPDSLLCEKLENLDDETNVIDIDRDARQFGLIRQLMLYKDRTRRRGITSAIERELGEDLEYYRLEHIWRYFESPDLDDLSSKNIEYMWPPFLKSAYTPLLKSVHIRPSSNRPSLVIKGNSLELAKHKSDHIFNTEKYTPYLIDDLDGPGIAMYFYLNSQEMALSYVSQTNSASHIPLDRILFIFLSAIEKYIIKWRLLVGRDCFRLICGQDLVSTLKTHQ